MKTPLEYIKKMYTELIQLELIFQIQVAEPMETMIILRLSRKHFDFEKYHSKPNHKLSPMTSFGNTFFSLILKRLLISIFCFFSFSHKPHLHVSMPCNIYRVTTF